MEKLELENLLALIASHFEGNDFKTLTTLLSLGLIWYPRNPSLIAWHKRVLGQYDDSFYEGTYQTSVQSARLLLRRLQSMTNFHDLVDVGAGAGAWSQAALEMGKKVLSIDGEWVRNVPKACEGLTYQYSDLDSTITSERVFDVSVCVEVAEHLTPERSAGLISDLCSLAPVAVFGAALPRQGGVGHINCRPSSFWIELFRRQHFSVFDAFRPAFWYDSRVAPWYAQNTFLFVSNARLEAFSHLPRPSLVDVYHPRVVLDSRICLQDHENGVVDPA
jgi:hypothetical protein